jgi:tetratricopeptide (TPR) repeat protein
MVLVDVRDDVARYRLLEPIRQYAQERLEDAGEAAEYAARHAAAVMALARSGEVDDYGPEEIASLSRFELEHANVRVALRWALTHDAAEEAVRVAAALFRFWERRGHFREGCAWLEEALERTPNSTSVYRGLALNALAFLYWRTGDFERAYPIAQAGLAFNRASGRTLAIAFALGNLGAIAYFRNDPGLGIAEFEESVALGREVAYRPFLSVVLAFLARSYLRLNGPFDQRVPQLLEESLALAENTGARYAMSQALMIYGDVYWRRGDSAASLRTWRRALAARSEIADPRGIAAVLERLAWSRVAARDFESAAWLFGATESQQRALGITLRIDEEIDHADMLDITRDALGDGFALPFAAGRAATLEQAAAMGLDITR